jgi:CelD/BcsL family acetyltransferase involved in cellulose biosynthesis
MEIRSRLWNEPGAPEPATWSALRASNPSLRSPYFSREFIDIVARWRGGVEVAVFEEDGRTVGYLPFERSAPGKAEPVGTPLSDYHGLIAAPGLRFDPLQWLDACALDRFDFDHLVVDQPGWAPHVRERRGSPYLDLTAGFEAWLQQRQLGGRSRFERLEEEGRALVRRCGALRFAFDVEDESVLDQLLAWKSGQYRRTLGAERDLFASPFMVGIVRDIFHSKGVELAGTLSALWSGDTLVAAHLGIRSAGVLHWWFPAYLVSLSHFSPGALLLLELARCAPAGGVKLIDFGKGAEGYKLRWSTGAFEVSEGCVMR